MNIVCQNKKISNAKIYQVIFGDNDGVLLVSEGCGYSDTNGSGCLNCYGRVAQLIIQEFDKKQNKFIRKTTTYRDKFNIKKDNIKKIMEVDEILSKCSIIREIPKKEKQSIGKTSYLWTAYDRPITYKTDCKECKKNHEVPPCQDVEKNKKMGLSDNYCSMQKQRQVKF